jgi:hypothetical protein
MLEKLGFAGAEAVDWPATGQCGAQPWPGCPLLASMSRMGPDAGLTAALETRMSRCPKVSRVKRTRA